MKKDTMSMRDFGEVVAAMVKNDGVACHVDTSRKDGHMYLVAGNEDSSVSTDIASLWRQCNMLGADIRQVAQATAQAMKDALSEIGAESTEESPMPEKNLNIAGAFHPGFVPKPEKEEQQPNQQCKCMGGLGGLKNLEKIPKNLRPELLKAIDEMLGEILNDNSNAKTEDDVKAAVLGSVLPMFVNKATVEKHPNILCRNFFDMYIVYYIKTDSGEAVMTKAGLADFSEEEIYSAAIKNMTEQVKYKSVLAPLGCNTLPAILITTTAEHGSVGVLGNGVLLEVAETMGDNLIVIMAENVGIAFPYSQINLNAFVPSFKKMAVHNDYLSDAVYVYNRNTNSIAAI